MAFSSISVLWNKWNIQSFVMLSLLLQVFLVLFAPLRKKTANCLVISLLWLAYLMADWAAAFAIGLISQNQSDSSARAAQVDGALQAFWASFLLLHLGGPDTITAFSIEESSLWRRHLLGLVFQVGSTIYIFVQIFPRDKAPVISTMLVFLSGVIKNVERTLALNLSSFRNLSEWAFSQRRLRDNVPDKSIRDSILSQPVSSNQEEAKLPESIVVKHAFHFFKVFMVLLGDLMFTCEERQESCEYFHKVSAVDALRVISVELQFMYEVLHTKTLAIRSVRSYIFRFIAFTNIVMAFVLFNRLKKHQLPELDVKITYSLVFGGIALDVIALLMLIFSDWTVAGIKRGSFFHKLVSAADDQRKPWFVTLEVQPNANVTYTVLDTSLPFRRWSESISACNLLSEFYYENPRKMCKRHGCWGIVAFSSTNAFLLRAIVQVLGRGCFLVCCFWFHRIYYRIPRIADTEFVSKNPFIKELWIFIFTEVRTKSEKANSETGARKIFEAKGDLFLESEPTGIDCSNLLAYVTQPNFDATIMTWHIATEMWYNIDKPTAKNDEREFSKILSDYMMYLLLNQCNVMSAVAGIAQIRSEETVEEMRSRHGSMNQNEEELCKRLYEDSCPSAEGSALSEGIKLARDMERLGDGKWKVMSGVWVEMLCYAAVHVQGEAQVQVLSKGGDLLAFVRLLMAHFGCLYKPERGICADFAARVCFRAGLLKLALCPRLNPSGLQHLLVSTCSDVK